MINAEDYEWIGIVNPEDVRPGASFVTPLAFYYYSCNYGRIEGEAKNVSVAEGEPPMGVQLPSSSFAPSPEAIWYYSCN